MTISTIVQNPFLVNSYSELDTSWPDGSVGYCRGDNTVYQLSGGVWGSITGTSNDYVNGVRYKGVFSYFASATVSGGSAVFYLTDNGLSSGNAVFKNNVFTQSINLIVSSTTATYQYGSPSIGTGNKSITIPVTQLGLSLGILNFTTAANGTTVLLQISGN